MKINERSADNHLLKIVEGFPLIDIANLALPCEARRRPEIDEAVTKRMSLPVRETHHMMVFECRDQAVEAKKEPGENERWQTTDPYKALDLGIMCMERKKGHRNQLLKEDT